MFLNFYKKHKTCFFIYAVNHISHVRGPLRGFAGYLTLCYTLVSRFVYLDNDGSSV